MADRSVKVVSTQGMPEICAQIAKTTSTAFEKNSLVEYASGVINPSDDNDTTVHAIILEEVASTDSDYATSGAKKTVQVLRPTDIVEITSTAVLTPGTAYGISNAYTVDSTDVTNKVCTCVKALSATKAWVTFKTYSGSNNL